MQTRKRAILIGEKTDGGAHVGASYRLHQHLEVFIPVGRVINPVTGRNWEGSGVTPDISIPSEKAFEIAYRMALESILVSNGDSPSGPFKTLAKEALTALEKRCQTLPDTSR